MISKYYKAVVSFVGVLAVGLTALSSSTDFNAVLPTAGSGWIVTAGAVVVGALGFLVRNKKTIDQVDTAIESGDFSLQDLESLIAKWNAPR